MTLTHGTSSKLGPATYSTTLPIRSTCPTSCLHHPDNEATCYAYQGPMRWAQDRWTRNGKGQDPTREEPALMESIPLGSTFRAHVAGDFVGLAHLRAVVRVVKRKALKAWSYTHNWRKLKPTHTDGMTLFASCESMADVREAHAKGFPTALVHPGTHTRAFDLGDGFTGIPCPYETDHTKTCGPSKDGSYTGCRLCQRGAWLHATKRVIVFHPHGSRKGALTQALIQIGDPA